MQAAATLARTRRSPRSARLRVFVLRCSALFALLFATTSTQELISLALGSGCCQGETCPEDEEPGVDGTPCRACSHCGHASGVLPPAVPLAGFCGSPLATAARANDLALTEHRTPPFRPPT